VKREVSKNFFFEKKKQKTFGLFGPRAPQRPATKGIKSFLLPRAGRLFFKKEVLAYFLLAAALGANHPHMTKCDAEL
jgi:hypothetical protein